MHQKVFFHEPVPTKEISNTINKYDVGLTIIPPVTRNEEMALPNKLFESAQARLAVVTGPNSDMASLVREHGNGLVLEDWSVSALVQCLSGLTSIQVASMKSRSHEKALEFSDERDIEVFREQLRRFGR